MTEKRQRQEGTGSPEVPNVLKKEQRDLAEAMRENGWTFTEMKESVRAFAPYWVEGGVSYVGLGKTPSDKSRAFKNNRSLYRRWCRENDLTPNI